MSHHPILQGTAAGVWGDDTHEVMRGASSSWKDTDVLLPLNFLSYLILFLLWLFHSTINLIIVSDEINQSISSHEPNRMLWVPAVDDACHFSHHFRRRASNLSKTRVAVELN